MFSQYSLDESSLLDENSTLSQSSLTLEQEVEKLKIQVKLQREQFDSDRGVLLGMIEKTTEDKEQVCIKNIIMKIIVFFRL